MKLGKEKNLIAVTTLLDFLHKQSYRINCKHYITQSHYQCSESGSKKAKCSYRNSNNIISKCPEKVLFDSNISCFAKPESHWHFFQPLAHQHHLCILYSNL